MKVAFAVRRLSHVGGMESNVLRLLEFLVQRGHDVTVVCQKVDPAVSLEAEIVRVWAPGFLGESLKTAYFAQAAGDRLRQVGAPVSMTSSHVVGAKVVRLESGVVSAYRESSQSLRVRLDPTESVAEWVEGRKLREARRILVLSERGKNEVLRRYGVDPSRLRVVRNGIDVSRFPLASKRDARVRLGIDADRFVVAFVGTGFHRKGLDRLIDAMADPEAPKSGLLLVAGSDGAAQEFLARARRIGVEVRFLGRVDPVHEVITAADTLALLSRYEPFGLVVLEALALGRPVVVSDVVGAADVVPFPELVIGPGQSIARALGRCAELSRDPNTEGRCRRVAESHPNRATFETIESILQEVASEQ